MRFAASMVDGVEILVMLTGALDVTEREVESLVSLAAMGLPLIVDLSGVTFIDDHGIRTLERARDACTRSGSSFALRSPSAAVIRACLWPTLADDVTLTIED